MFLLRHSVCFSVTVWITPLSSSFSRTACHELFFVQQRNGHCTPINVEGALYENMAGIVFNMDAAALAESLHALGVEW